jgi:Protein-disulfide isomerase
MIFLRTTLLLSSLLTTVLAPVQAISNEAQEIIGKTAANYLKEHPEEVTSIVQALQNHHESLQEKQNQEKVQQISDKLFTIPTGLPVIGNPIGSDELVVFMDPFCGFCRRFKETLQTAIAQNPNLKIIIRDIAIMDEKSILVTKALLAAAHQGKYPQLQQALYQVDTSVTKEDILAQAKQLQLDMVQFNKDLDSPKIEALFKQNMELASEINLTGTPTFIIKKTHKMMAGAVDVETLQDLLQKS